MLFFSFFFNNIKLLLLSHIDAATTVLCTSYFCLAAALTIEIYMFMIYVSPCLGLKWAHWVYCTVIPNIFHDCVEYRTCVIHYLLLYLWALFGQHCCWRHLFKTILFYLSSFARVFFMTLHGHSLQFAITWLLCSVFLLCIASHTSLLT